MNPVSIPSAPLPGIDLPNDLQPLVELAYNLRWTWKRETQELFARIDPESWSTNISPVALLRRADSLKELAGDSEYVAKVRAAADELREYLAVGHSSLSALVDRLGPQPVAYFCAEYALHTGMNQYAGGLGILAGDHCKEASDLGLPFVAVGLLYRRGFFHQRVDWSGRQEAFYPTYSPGDLPVRPVVLPGQSKQLTVSLPLSGRTVAVAVWLMQVGKTPLLLLDTDLPENLPEDRMITSQLYTNGREMRLCQEVILGVGGVRALEALGVEPCCYHLNEGHSALLIVERLRNLRVSGAGHNEALARVKRTSMITIHTPVPEGNERFSADLVATSLADLVEDSGLTPTEILKDGLGADEDPQVFDMTAFALRHCSRANGVSLLHGQTADRTWRAVLGRPVEAVTNGMHLATWLGPEMRQLFEAAGARFEPATDLEVGPEERPLWHPAMTLDPDALWRAHQKQKHDLIVWAQQRLFDQFARHGEGPTVLSKFAHALDPEAFLIGFSRRFATYKRATLLFSDLHRALRLLDGHNRKIQVLFAGKSHPSDRSGQALIEQVFQLTRSHELEGKIFLLEDYDMETGARLVQGVDLWLNTPRRPLEASGTSGMKAAANGVPNLSILDGWWDEGYCADPPNGWAIGNRRIVKAAKRQDRQDALSLYEILESEVIPCFFDRDASGFPQAWTEIMRNAIATSLFSFSTVRMLRDYAAHFYLPIAAGE